MKVVVNNNEVTINDSANNVLKGKPQSLYDVNRTISNLTPFLKDCGVDEMTILKVIMYLYGLAEVYIPVDISY